MSCNKVLRVAADGSGDFRTVQEAVDAVPFSNRTRTVIQVAPGVYRQPVYVPKTKDFITLAGSCPDTTVLTWDNTASRIDHHQSPLVIGTGTFGCGSTIVEGEDFIVENITFENSAPQGSGQAVAIRVTADRCAFYNCRFDPCRCIITGNGGTSYAFLGRPWGPFARVVFAYTWMDCCIRPFGWHNWDKSENERSACFYEYRCSGPGCCLTNRVAWSRELLDDEAGSFISHPFVDPDPDRPWLAQKMAVRIPYSA
ncbi:hypothetical protein ZIOFF_010629 [Zingiber officinale]|uniref:pectinesterase n=1 Tax=Zingiber officinale TaxID=94328 RepID=A0A8J5LZP7_ZINOF|nr:hypothetical protein ZIOFF_010629 [Zingiber officinale]